MSKYIAVHTITNVVKGKREQFKPGDEVLGLESHSVKDLLESGAIKEAEVKKPEGAGTPKKPRARKKKPEDDLGLD